jgi:hypothetical protein
MLGLVSSSIAFADGFAPGEGLYVGAFAGAGMGIVQPKVVTQGGVTGGVLNSSLAAGGTLHNTAPSEINEAGNSGGSYEAADGGLGLAGFEGGGTLGYGYRMGDLYAGIEGEMAAGDVTFKLTASNPIQIGSGTSHVTRKTIQTIEATKDWTGGMFGRLGFYVNPDTLLAFRGGVLVSKFEVTTTGSTNYTEDFYGGGPSFGASLESRITAIDPNLSVRMGAVYTDFLTASVFGIGGNTGTNTADRSGHNSEVTGSDLSAVFVPILPPIPNTLAVRKSVYTAPMRTLKLGSIAVILDSKLAPKLGPPP